jgi:hypothetical protein
MDAESRLPNGSWPGQDAQDDDSKKSHLCLETPELLKGAAPLGKRSGGANEMLS